MGTVLLVVLVAGAVVFLMNRSRETAPAGAAPVTAQRSKHDGVSRTARPRLTAEQCRELARIHRQNILDRQHDSRMSAAAAVAGVVTGAALTHHHDADDDGLSDDGVDWDNDWSIDDGEDYGGGESDYSNDDYGSYGDYSGSGHDDDYGGYGGDDYSGGGDGGF
ncbi:hypothetical protein [uncultured Mitsuokella sp.]|uniref:hypothetical protein n=1 Tax=uncultured Mitsuokella sp. TaxID=453120 RepID=UPI00266C2DDD|nr:hypothetical protein [uncultured Mitsuokella sp.]